jgi:hypothetical protein
MAVSSTSSTGSAVENEWRDMMVAQERFTRVSLINIGPSKIHGRGTLAARDIARGERLGLLWFDYFANKVICDQSHAPSVLMPKRGYISSGGDIKKRRMSVQDAIEECSDWKECMGFTFIDDQGSNICPRDLKVAQCNVSEIRDIEFKDHGSFGLSEEWQSFVKPTRAVTFFPQACNSNTYPEGSDRDGISDSQALVCWVHSP